MTERICIYHKDCSDGKGGALAVWMKYGSTCLYHAAARGSPPPYEVWGREVILVDFCYPRSVMVDITRLAESVIVLDHHKTEADAMRQPFSPDVGGNIKSLFDMESSGAVLAWRYFHPDIPLPSLLWHIQDRDLNRHQSKYTKAIIEGLKYYPNFRDWTKFIDGSWSPQALHHMGSHILDFVSEEARKWLAVKPRKFIDGHVVPVYNLPDFMVCDTLAMALNKYECSPYAVSYYDKDDTRVYSLRSREGSHVDVGVIARRFGGGGHKHSAGFTMVHITSHKVL